MLYYGTHLSIKTNLLSLIDYIKKIDGNMIQIFISNPISTKSKPNQKIIEDAELIKQKSIDMDVKIVIHLPYTLNIGKQYNKNTWWIKTIIDHLNISEKIGSIGCVIHVGKHLNLSKYDGTNNMYKSLKYIIYYLKKNNMKTHIILETAAGQGTELLSEIKKFIEFYKLFTDEDKEYLRLCIDTCHIFAAGEDISTKKNVKNFFKYLHNSIGMKYIDLIHLNDSKKECGSCVDRHENIGEGCIGKEGLTEFIRCAFLYRIPIILETPDNFINEIKIFNSIKQKFIF